MEFDATVIEVRGLASVKTSSIHNFLHKKMPVPSQEYDSCYPSVVFFIHFAIYWGLSFFNFPWSSIFL